MSVIPTSDVIGPSIIRALGLPENRVRRLELVFEANAHVVVRCEFFADALVDGVSNAIDQGAYRLVPIDDEAA